MREKTRLAVSVGGVAVAVMLIMLLRGLYTGVNEQAGRYLRSVGADVWVAQEGTRGGFGHSVSVLPRDLADLISGVDGVAEAAPLLGRPVLVTTEAREADVLLMGFDPSLNVGGPPRVVEGTGRPAPGEIILDRVFAALEGFRLGDELRISGNRFRVAGIGEGGSSLITSYAWAPIDDVDRLTGTPGVVSYFVARAAEGLDPELLRDRITREVPGTTATTAADFIADSTADIRESFLPILFALTGIGVMIGTAVIGLTVYTSVLEKRSEYGVLKAVGFSNSQLLGIVWRQALMAGGLGFGVGAVLTVAVASLLERAVPQFVVVLQPVDLPLVALATASMSVLASFLPIQGVTRLEPAAVFRV